MRLLLLIGLKQVLHETCLFFPIVLSFSEFQLGKERDYLDKQWKLEEWIAIVLLVFNIYPGRLAMDLLGVGSSTPLEQTEMPVGLSNLIGATTFLILFKSVLSSVHSDSF